MKILTQGQIIFAMVSGVVFVAHLMHLWRISQHWQRTKFLKAKSMTFAARELIEFSRAFYKYEPGLEDRAENIRDVFLREAMRSYLTGAVRGHEWLHSLRAKADGYRLSLYSRLEDVQKLASLLPAMGWVVALAALGSYLYDGPGQWSTSRLTTTYSSLLLVITYGLCIFHFVVYPMAQMIEKHARETYEKNVFLIQCIAMFLKKTSSIELYESVNLLLPEGNKLDWTELSPVPGFDEKSAA